ncbi:sterol 24-C-methyltransferase [Ascoidea rubescens DSM 1968]|uniref:Sterol 24-C-methyltransferase n=1 Tax=Ascoidea rubescens DSM 1968 TaxID=1344418 RepID=A0A1D2VK46_9ASCO|nr:sterol 24-C-methyltransferase [Ascoidea rubescens DSM 1968]ODV61991.1 sterol 24-C-methyltransferase [Ascoidea rubescens DSM 1968]
MSEIKPVITEETKKQDKEFSDAYHKDSVASTGLTALFRKNKTAQEAALEGYFRHWDGKTDAEAEERRLKDYKDGTNNYYNLVTDFYEYGWGSSFHFCRFFPGDSFQHAVLRHEDYLALKMGITEDMTVLDVGCGVGGPSREIQKFTGCRIIGLNNNDYQIQRANNYAAKNNLTDKLTYVKGDFMKMDFPENSFDAVYAIEATVHAPVLNGVYSEIYKVLKPGGVFGVYEWVMTDKYDSENEHHRQIAYGIEIGDGIPKMYKREVAEKALIDVGFNILYQKDLADNDDATPWYYPLAGDWKYIQTFADVFSWFRTSNIGRKITTNSLGVLEKLRLVPKGSVKVADALEEAAVNLVAGGREKLFTPMMLYIVKKPENVPEIVPKN